MNNPRHYAMIRNLIIDLCGPLLQIDVNRINERFHQQGISAENPYMTLYREGRVKAFDRGEITPSQFWNNVRQVLHCQLTDDELQDIWNSLVVDFDPRIANVLHRLSQNHKLFLLSNSDVVNATHFLNYIRKHCGDISFDDCFEELYFSYQLGLRKPDPAIFQAILQRHHLIPQETLFIDDSPKNCSIAATLGIQTHCWKVGN